jgi:hypothetical protein
MYVQHSIVCHNESVLTMNKKNLDRTENKNFIGKQNLLENAS